MRRNITQQTLLPRRGAPKRNRRNGDRGEYLRAERVEHDKDRAPGIPYGPERYDRGFPLDAAERGLVAVLKWNEPSSTRMMGLPKRT